MPDAAHPLALAVTLALEVPIVAAGLDAARPLPRRVAVAVAGAVALAEAAAYRVLLGGSLRRAAAVSAAANALSTLGGLLVWRALQGAAGP
ncbi:MAG TPA: hypothetical protein VLS93_14710 [Anaeromyxobacteraceae bacterium]|nr:hypothetical protein [Anaeromyxobacteraceae bacterium]